MLGVLPQDLEIRYFISVVLKAEVQVPNSIAPRLEYAPRRKAVQPGCAARTMQTVTSALVHDCRGKGLRSGFLMTLMMPSGSATFH
jgi:hypothetical protein